MQVARGGGQRAAGGAGGCRAERVCVVRACAARKGLDGRMRARPAACMTHLCRRARLLQHMRGHGAARARAGRSCALRMLLRRALRRSCRCAWRPNRPRLHGTHCSLGPAPERPGRGHVHEWVCRCRSCRDADQAAFRGWTYVTWFCARLAASVIDVDAQDPARALAQQMCQSRETFGSPLSWLFGP